MSSEQVPWPEFTGNCPRSNNAGIMLFVHVLPIENNDFGPEKFRWECIRGIQQCEHEPNVSKNPDNSIFNGSMIDDTNMGKRKNGESRYDNMKTTTHGKIIEYWFPTTDESSMRRMNYVKKYWNWFADVGSKMVKVRFESYHHYREGTPDKRHGQLWGPVDRMG